VSGGDLLNVHNRPDGAQRERRQVFSDLAAIDALITWSRAVAKQACRPIVRVMRCYVIISAGACSSRFA